MLTLKTTTQFNKDLKLIKKRWYNIKKLEKIVDRLLNQEVLEEKYRDHKLQGDYAGCRECHIEPDWLLIYYMENNVLTLTLSRTGTHSDLF